jgi:hypothetical protein
LTGVGTISTFQPLKVLFIGGASHTGSTLLCRMLGLLPGFFPLGELHEFWRKDGLESLPCGCGERLADCPIWAPAFASAEARAPIERDGRHPLSCSVARRRYLLPLAIPGLRGSRFRKRFRHQTERLGRILGGLRDRTGCRVFVDSSKELTHARLLSETPGVRLFGIHLVRDSRATVHSFYRRGIGARPSSSVGRGPLRSICRGIVEWWIANFLCECFFPPGCRLLRIRYEDLVDHPAPILRRLAAFVGEAAGNLEFLRGDAIGLPRQHLLAGNPVRMTSGIVPLRRDDEWKRSPIPTSLVRLLTSPLLRRYGYDGTPAPEETQPPCIPAATPDSGESTDGARVGGSSEVEASSVRPKMDPARPDRSTKGS